HFVERGHQSFRRPGKGDDQLRAVLELDERVFVARAAILNQFFDDLFSQREAEADARARVERNHDGHRGIFNGTGAQVLPYTILENLKVGLLEAGDDGTLGIGDEHLDEHEVAIDADSVEAALRLPYLGKTDGSRECKNDEARAGHHGRATASLPPFES